MWLVLSIVAVVLISFIILYNGLIRGRSMVREAWSGIDVQLKRRAELIPNLVETVKAYKNFEAGTLEKVTAMRSTAQSAEGVAQRGEAEKKVSLALVDVFVLAEAYPELRASQNYIKLQDQLVDVEDQLQYARRYYNGTVRDMNIRIQSFPGNIVAGLMGFAEPDYFQLESDSEKIRPDVKLS